MDGESGARSLAGKIRREIESGGPITFARFMERALYDPEGGYYARGPVRFGPGGDYFTASDLGPHFGRALARQIVEIGTGIAPAGPFQLVEIGCGRGLLMRDVLDELESTAPALRRRVHPILVDRSDAMRAAAGALVPQAEIRSALDAGSLHHACVLSVELFDALPVHRLRRRGTTLVEIGVGLDRHGNLTEVEIPPSPAVRALAERYGAAQVDGAEAEVAPAAAAMLQEILASVACAVILIVDYGDVAPRLYASRTHGTLVAYRRHRTGSDLLSDVGEQDLTAHVNFSLLEDTARETGADVLGRTSQDRFLIANGILEAFEPGPPGERPGPRAAKARLQALQLIHPAGMGRIFQFLALSKGLQPAPHLSGLRDPFSRDAPTGRGENFS